MNWLKISLFTQPSLSSSSSFSIVIDIVEYMWCVCVCVIISNGKTLEKYIDQFRSFGSSSWHSAVIFQNFSRFFSSYMSKWWWWLFIYSGNAENFFKIQPSFIIIIIHNCFVKCWSFGSFFFVTFIIFLILNYHVNFFVVVVMI